MTLALYQLIGKDGRHYSGPCWRVRMALAHKALDAQFIDFYHGDVEKLAFSGQTKVPVLVDGDRIVCGSWAIACYLDDAYPDRPALMKGPHGRALTRMVNIWADTQLDPPIVRSSFLDILHNLHPSADPVAFRTARERRMGRTLEALQADHEADVAELGRNLQPLRTLLDAQPYLNGAEPAYADYIVFGSLQFPRCLVGRRFIADGDPVLEWFRRMTALFDGLGHGGPIFSELP